MPLPSSVYTSLNTDAKAKAAIGATVQIPFAVAALGIFYNKALPTPALALNCRLLARAYTGSLTRWSDPELVAANNFSAAASSSYLDAPLVVYGMQGPAGSTLALTGWLAASCGDVWGQGLTANVTWAPQVVTSYVAPGSPSTARTPILSPDDLAAALASAPGSLGYLPAPLGKSLGLAEAALLLAPGAAAVRSGGADLTAVIARARTTTPNLFTDATADLAAALSAGSNGGGLYGQTANGSWPMPIVQYMLMYRNLTGYGYSGPLLRALAEFLLSSEGAALATASGLAPPPPDVLAAARGDLARAALKTLTVVWSSEGAGSYDSTGSALYTFSANRDSWESAALAELQATVADLRSQLVAALPTPLRLACAAGLMPLTRLLRNDLQAISTSPLRFTDEIIPSSSAAASELLAAEREAAAAAPVHLVLTPGPLAAAAWRAVAAAMPVVQLPAALRPVAVVYKGLSGLRLGGCTLARILRGDITAWNAQAIRDDNPGLALPGNPIRLITAGPEDTDARAVLAYLSDPALVGAGCGGAAAAAAGLAIPTAGVVDNAAVVDEVAAGALYSGLGFVAASELAAAPALSGVHAAALPSLVSNTFVRPNQTGTIRDAATCPATGCGGAVAAAYSAAFDEILAAVPAGSLGVPAAVDGDWSNFTARPLGVLPTTDVYPIFRLDFYVAPADLVHFGAAGEAARGLLVYGLSGDLAARISGGLGPAFAGLGPAARRLAAAALAAVQTAAADGGKWAVAASSAAANASQPATSSPALVLSRLPPLADSALPASDAAVFAASSSDSSAAGDISGTAYQAAAEAVRTTWDKASLAYDIAVAALVLACVLSVAALGLAVWALQKVRAVEGAATAGGGCFTPAAAKYEKHTDVAHPPPGLAAGGPATTAVEMGAYDKI